jgi:hypothetical protein
MRPPPTLMLTLELEQGHAGLRLVADTWEDERRLRAWLRRSGALAELSATLERLLDDLDEQDRRAAA